MFFGASIADGEILNPTSQYTATVTLDGGTGLYYVAIAVTPPTNAFVVAAAAATVPSTITSANNTFSFGGVVYTVASGTYSTAATLMTAMSAALAGATAFSTVCTLTNSSGTFTATAVVSGTPGNGLTFAEGNGFLASGFGAQVLAGGSGGARRHLRASVRLPVALDP